MTLKESFSPSPPIQHSNKSWERCRMYRFDTIRSRLTFFQKRSRRANMVALPFFEIALVLVRLDYVARFITKPLTTIRPLLYTRRYDYQISCAHFCNRPCQHLSCASSVTDPD